MTEKYCSMCKEKLKDGEIVSSHEEDYCHTYHIIDSSSLKPRDCATKKAITTGNPVRFDRKIYYKGNFYDLHKLDGLLDKINLIIDFNENNNGDIIKGNLDGLLKN
jgi:hypothetical protein